MSSESSVDDITDSTVVTYSENAENVIDHMPTQATGQGSGQSSAVKDVPNNTTKSKESATRTWAQQSASVASQTTKEKQQQGADTPWGQQSLKQKTGGADEQGAAEATGAESSEKRIRRVIIDSATGLYIETSLDSTNSTVSENANMSFENRQEDLMEWPFWDMDGRIGLTVKTDSYNGSVNWEQEGEAIDFRFRGPLGFGGIRIHGSLDEQVRVKTTTGQDFTVADFESEMQARMGWSIPINSLRYWALGIVDPEVDADVVMNEEDLLDELVQGEWKVVYDRYKDVDGVQLPSKFKITGPATKIRMLVNDWSIPGAE